MFMERSVLSWLELENPNRSRDGGLSDSLGITAQVRRQHRSRSPRNPDVSPLIDLILLFISSTPPFESRSLVQGKIPSGWERSILTNFLMGSSRERIAEFIHLWRRSSARLG